MDFSEGTTPITTKDVQSAFQRPGCLVAGGGGDRTKPYWRASGPRALRRRPRRGEPGAASTAPPRSGDAECAAALNTPAESARARTGAARLHLVEVPTPRRCSSSAAKDAGKGRRGAAFHGRRSESARLIHHLRDAAEEVRWRRRRRRRPRRTGARRHVVSKEWSSSTTSRPRGVEASSRRCSAFKEADAQTAAAAKRHRKKNGRRAKLEGLVAENRGAHDRRGQARASTPRRRRRARKLRERGTEAPPSSPMQIAGERGNCWARKPATCEGVLLAAERSAAAATRGQACKEKAPPGRLHWPARSPRRQTRARPLFASAAAK